MLSDNWLQFLQKMGPALNRVEPEPEVADSHKGRLPDDFLDLWRDQGWASYLGGRFRVADPSPFDDLLKILLGDDADFRPQDCVIYAFTVFGRLYGLHSVHETFKIDLISYEMTASYFFDQSEPPDPSSAVLAALYVIDPRKIDPKDEGTSRPLFVKAVKTLGLPDADECYGFFPALPLGGVRRLSNLRRVKAVEHFALLAQLQPLMLMDYKTFPPKKVRTIGSPPVAGPAPVLVTATPPASQPSRPARPG